MSHISVYILSDQWTFEWYVRWDQCRFEPDSRQFGLIIKVKLIYIELSSIAAAISGSNPFGFTLFFYVITIVTYGIWLRRTRNQIMCSVISDNVGTINSGP